MADAIVTGEFAPGLRLDEHSIAARFGVSRTPVREALRELASSGLIEIQPRRGATVTRITSQQLDEMFVAMAEIEATCARLAALTMTPLERRRLQALHDQMGEMAREENQKAYSEANDVFHAALYAGAHNSVMADIALKLRRRLLPFRHAQFRAQGRLALSHAEHGAVVSAVLRGDAGQAHAAMLHHVGLVEDAFENLAPRLIAK
ncbi:GntR family transcriptional regulator [Terrarubrum flagellatum]|uniref:GntR family transcriptional regulator n=1 Tax=Terrirubrum flagellatum TaxID=2895980 RepID=UPI003144DC3E